MGQKNKGRPKRLGDRQPRPPGDHQGGGPRDRRNDRKDDQKGERRGSARGHDRPHSADRREATGAPESKRGAARFEPRKGGRSQDRQNRQSADRPAGEKRAPRRFEARKPSGEVREHRPDAADETGEARPERREGKPSQHDRLWIYGRHAAVAAITNQKRVIKRILVSGSALEWIDELRVPRERLSSLMKVAQSQIDASLHSGAVHQGIAVEVEDLPRARLKEDCAPESMRPVVVLDQITDPHNIGAIFRSAAAFGARAIIVQDRKTPPLAGALAKAAAGSVEIVPCVQVVNIARSLDGLKSLGYYCAALAGDSGAPVSSIPKDRPVALVLGAEGAGLRKLVRETCDGAYAIPIARGVDSLNVSNAAAVTLYEITRLI